MSTWRNPVYMRRRQMRLMAEDQQRSLHRQHAAELRRCADALADALHHNALAGAGLGQAADPIADTVACDAAGQPPRKPLH